MIDGFAALQKDVPDGVTAPRVVLTGQTRGGMYGNAADLVAHDLDLAHMNRRPDVELERAKGLDDRQCTINGLRGPLEADEEPVAGGTQLADGGKTPVAGPAGLESSASARSNSKLNAFYYAHSRSSERGVFV